MTDIERLMNVFTYFRDYSNISSWIDHFVCIVFFVYLYLIAAKAQSPSKVTL